MNLSKRPPRSMRETVLGVVLLARVMDKANAKLHGSLGEYIYGSPIDDLVFDFLGITADDLLTVCERAGSDAEVERYLSTFVCKKSTVEIDAFNKSVLTREPEGDGEQRYFDDLRRQVAPERDDIRTWVDLFDLDDQLV
jgi:hypothetical protein